MDAFIVAASVGSISILLATAALFLTRNLVIERLKGAIAHEYGLKLETHKAEVASANQRSLELFKAEASRQQAILTTMLSSISAAHLAGHQRTLDAIDTVWKETQRIAEWLPLHASRSDILLEEELSRDEIYVSLVAKVDEYEQVKSLDGDHLVERVRPFVGEYLYSQFVAYRAFTGRVATLLLRSYRNGAPRLFNQDQYTRQLLAVVLGEQGVDLLHLELPGRIRRAQAAIERQMLEHIAKVLSGEASAVSNLKKAHEIVTAALSDET